MARSLSKRLVDWALGRTLVGRDSYGRVYFELLEKSSRGVTRRRTFEGDAETPTPPEWNAWLRRTREKPPTMEECAEIEAERKRRAAGVAALAGAEEQRRLRDLFAAGRGGGEAVGLKGLQEGPDRR